MKGLYKEAGKQCAFYAIVIFLCYMLFLNPIAVTDVISDYAVTGPMPDSPFAPYVVEWYFASGRLMNLPIRIFYYGLALIGVTHLQNAFVIQLLGIALFALSATLMERMYAPFIERDPQKYALKGAILLAFVNPMMVEPYCYGAFDFALGISLSVYAAFLLCKKKWIAGLIASLLSVCTYQSNVLITVLLLVAHVFLCHVLHHETLKNSFLSLLKSAGLVFLSALINLSLQALLVRLFVTTEPVKAGKLTGNIAARVSTVLGYVRYFWSMQLGLLPSYVTALVLLLIIMLSAAALYRKKEKILPVVLWFAVCFALGLIPFTLFLIYPLMMQRTLLPAFFSVTLFFVAGVLIAGKERCMAKAVTVLLGSYLIFVLFHTQRLIADCYTLQAIDIREARMIGNEISDYEKKSGNIVTNLVIGADKTGVEYVYDELLVNYIDTNAAHRILYDAWVRGFFLNYVNGTDYVWREMTEEEYARHFKESDEILFSPSRQMLFEGDTLYLIIY